MFSQDQRMRTERRGRGHLISFWFLFSMCLLNTYSMPSTVLGLDVQRSKTRQVSSHGVCVSGEGEEEGQIPYTHGQACCQKNLKHTGKEKASDLARPPSATNPDRCFRVPKSCSFLACQGAAFSNSALMCGDLDASELPPLEHPR